MRVGYISNLFISDNINKITDKVHSLTNEARELDLNFLVCSGGISRNYQTTVKFVEELGKQLTSFGIGFRFIVGNTDYYYPKDSEVNKQAKFRKIQAIYNASPYYLPNNPINAKNTRIHGFESWYDYSLYRGKPRELKSITNKSFFGFKNDDVVYITNKHDYLSGIEDTFDIRYCHETQSKMISKLDLALNKWGTPLHNVAVMWFVPSINFLKNTPIEKYMGTFKGSQKYLDILCTYNISECIIGIKCNDPYPERLRGIKFLNSSNQITVVEY